MWPDTGLANEIQQGPVLGNGSVGRGCKGTTSVQKGVAKAMEQMSTTEALQKVFSVEGRPLEAQELARFIKSDREGYLALAKQAAEYLGVELKTVRRRST